MKPTKRIRPDDGELPYEFCWEAYYDDGTSVRQYDESGYMTLWAAQERTGLHAIAIYRHPSFEGQRIVPNVGAMIYPVPIVLPTQGEEVHIAYRQRCKKDESTGHYIYLLRRQMVVRTSWCELLITPEGFNEVEPTMPGGRYEITFNPVPVEAEMEVAAT